MTQTMINGKSVRLSMADKAKLLQVSQIAGEAGYIVSSGSTANKSYRVSDDCSQCNCESYGQCSHKIAAHTFKMSQQPRRVATCCYCGGYHSSSNCPF